MGMEKRVAQRRRSLLIQVSLSGRRLVSFGGGREEIYVYIYS